MTRRTHGTAGKSGKGRANKLNKEALQVVEEEAHRIAQALVESAKKGDKTSARLLVELGEGEAEAGEVVKERRLFGLAAKLAAEPQWPLDLPEEGWGEEIDAETEAEGKEVVSA